MPQSDFSHEDAEKLYFNLFPTQREDNFKRVLLLTTYKVIDGNNNITLNKLKHHLHSHYRFSAEDVEIAVQALYLKSIFFSVGKFCVQPKGQRTEEVIHLSVKSRRLIDSWVTATLEANPELTNMVSNVVA